MYIVLNIFLRINFNIFSFNHHGRIHSEKYKVQNKLPTMN